MAPCLGESPVSGCCQAVDSVVEFLKQKSAPISSTEEIVQVGTISANGDVDIGKLIGTAMEKVGRDGVITTADGNTLLDELEVVEGMKFDRGFISPYFVTDAKSQECVLEDAYILIVEKKVSSVQSLLPVLEAVHASRKPLLVLAEDVESDALAALILNKLRAGVKVCAVKAPGFGDNRKANLQDIAELTGGLVISEDVGLITITKDNTMILGGAGTKEAIAERCQAIRDQIERVWAMLGAGVWCAVDVDCVSRVLLVRPRPTTRRRSCRSAWASCPAVLPS
jgi:chaperonin GroEL